MPESISQREDLLVLVADLLAQAASHSDSSVVQWLEAALKVHDKQQVAQMLAKSPAIVRTQYGGTALHHAARHGHELVAAQLLTENPDLVDAVDDYGWGALRCAAILGHDKVVAVLLAKSPNSITMNGTGTATLHNVVRLGYEKVVAQLLTVNPSLATIVDSDGETALHCAALNGHEAIVDMLLAIDSQLIQGVTGRGQTVLHMASRSGSQNKQFFTKLLELNPAALRAVNNYSQMPFEVALAHRNEQAIESMQWALTFDEVAGAYTARKKSYEERLRPIVEQQCECLVGVLNQDVISAMFEYLGFETKRLPRKSADQST